MAELAAGAFLSSFLQVAFERLASCDFLDYFHHRKLDVGLLKKLRIILNSVDKIVEDAEERQYRDHHVKQWLDELKDEVFNAQDLLDDIATEASRQKLKAESQNALMGKVRGFFTPLVNGNKPDNQIESRIKQVLTNLEYLVKQNEILGLKEGLSAGIQLGVNRNVCERAPTTLLIDKSNMYGRNSDKEIIVGKLLSQNVEGNQLPTDVIAIHGMGGIGKTTLAHLVYDDVRIKGQFQHRAWVCVSEEFDIDRVTKAILRSLNYPIDQTHDFHSCQLRLEEILTGKKLFLILDDVWNENCEIWETFQAPLKRVAPQSKILITTRNRTVAEVMYCAFMHSLKPLEDGDCWKLFSKHAFNNQCDAVDQGLVKIGREIVDKCGGLPLAIKTLGSLLHRRLSAQYWEKILKSHIWQLSENDSKIIPSLRLSYHYLPSNVKRCFAYCSIFAKDYDINKNVLIQLWMADGLIYPTQKSMSLEEEGNEIFNDLLSRSFFEPSREGGDYFIMHDLLNDLAKSMAGEFFAGLEAGQVADEGMSSKTRYFSYTSYRDEYLENFEKVFKFHQLRSFLLLRHGTPGLLPHHLYGDVMSRISHLKYIRVLTLMGCEEIRFVIDGIGNLKHLHYLDLSLTSIEELPNSLCLLINLQTLKLYGCYHLTKLPSNFCKLINLRHLDLDLCGIKKMPKHMRKLTQLRTMNKFIVGRKGRSNIKELGAFKHLTGSLTIEHTERITDATDVREANLKERQMDELWCLYKLRNYNREEAQHQEQVLEAFQPNDKVRRLHIGGYGGTKFPNWDMLPPLNYLKLWDCWAMERLPRGSMISNLQCLTIMSCPKLIASWRDWGLHELLTLKELYIRRCHDMESFPEEGLLPPNLQSLSLDCWGNLRRINHRVLVQLHSLTSLYFFGCPLLSFEDMPEDGLPPSLSHLTIAYGCPLLKKRCKKEKGPDWPKIAHIPHVDVEDFDEE